MTARRAWAFGLTVVAAGLASTPASADCNGPRTEHEAGPVARGQTIRVAGSGWGDSCYDTGPPPPGEGVLGRPEEDILIVIVQGVAEHIVAEGAADAEYAFEVDVPVPASLDPGSARLVVRRSGGAAALDEEITITDVPASPDAAEPVRFGPSRAPLPPLAPPAAGDPIPWAGVAFVAVIVVASGLVLGGVIVHTPRRVSAVGRPRTSRR